VSTELATTERPVTTSSIRIADMRESLQEQGEQRKVLMEYIGKHMIDGEDYGLIPGTKKKTLLKPGAEKLAQLFRCTPKYSKMPTSIEDWERPLFHYEFTCEIINNATGEVVAQGVGSCNSRETKYRWRQGERLCPNCGKPTIIKGKAEFGGGWLCFAKKGGCGAKFHDEDEAITSQSIDRVENTDVYDQVNSILKIAKKRALVDASLSLARCSDIFTQDLDDHPAEQTAAQPAKGAAPAKAAASIDHWLTALGNAKSFDECKTIWAEIQLPKNWKPLTPAQAQVLMGLKERRKQDFLEFNPSKMESDKPEDEYNRMASEGAA
jgi:hypothetical protein